MLMLVEDIARVEREIEQFLEGFKSLHRGELPIDLVSEAALLDVLSHPQEHINEKYEMFSLQRGTQCIIISTVSLHSIGKMLH